LVKSKSKEYSSCAKGRTYNFTHKETRITFSSNIQVERSQTNKGRCGRENGEIEREKEREREKELYYPCHWESNQHKGNHRGSERNIEFRSLRLLARNVERYAQVTAGVEKVAGFRQRVGSDSRDPHPIVRSGKEHERPAK